MELSYAARSGEMVVIRDEYNSSSVALISQLFCFLSLSGFNEEIRQLSTGNTADGHKSASMQTSHRGLLALQTSLP